MTQASVGVSAIQPLIVVPNAAAAIDFYTSVFGATEVWRLMHYQRVGHAVLRLGTTEIALLDEFPEAGIVRQEGGPRLMVWVPDVDAVVDAAVRAGATLVRSVEDQWWGVRSGAVRDPFGQLWSVLSVTRPMSSEEMQQRADELGLYPPPESRVAS